MKGMGAAARDARSDQPPSQQVATPRRAASDAGGEHALVVSTELRLAVLSRLPRLADKAWGCDKEDSPHQFGMPETLKPLLKQQILSLGR